MIKTFKKSWCVFAVLCFSTSLGAAEIASITDRKMIGNFLVTIPARHTNMAVILENYGVLVESVNVSEPDKFDIADESGLNEKNDRSIDISMREPIPQSLISCSRMPSINILKRRGKYIPITKTTNFLMTGRCELPK